MRIVNKQQFKSVAFPVIGAGTGSYRQAEALSLMLEVFANIDSYADVHSSAIYALMRSSGGAQSPRNRFQSSMFVNLAKDGRSQPSLARLACKAARSDT